VSRRVAILLLVVLAGAACGGDEPDDPVVDRTGEVPADVQAYLDRVADPSALTLDLTYDLLNKNGGGKHEVHVTSPPLTVTIDGEPVDLDDQPALAAYGIFAGFLAENPAAAIDAAARREDADDAAFSERDGMDCIAIPIAGTATSTWCLTDDGIFGYVDSPSVRYELRTS
jgi:hypothetical protein